MRGHDGWHDCRCANLSSATMISTLPSVTCPLQVPLSEQPRYVKGMKVLDSTGKRWGQELWIPIRDILEIIPDNKKWREWRRIWRIITRNGSLTSSILPLLPLPLPTAWHPVNERARLLYIRWAFDELPHIESPSHLFAPLHPLIPRIVI